METHVEEMRHLAPGGGSQWIPSGIPLGTEHGSLLKLIGFVDRKTLNMHQYWIFLWDILKDACELFPTKKAQNSSTAKVNIDFK